MTGELRHHVLAALPGNHVFSEAEHVRANFFAYECANIACLTRWETSIQVEVACCEAEAARQRRYYATHDRLRRLRAISFCGHCSRSLRPIWVVGALLPDRRVNTFDRLAAARFQPANVLSLGSLLNCQSR